MSLLVTCDNCGSSFWVEGFTTPDSWTEPGEVVTDLVLLDDTEKLCDCLNDGESFGVEDEEHETFPDDVM